MEYPIEVAVIDVEKLRESLYEDLAEAQKAFWAVLHVEIGIKKKIAELEGHPELWHQVRA